MSLEDLFFVGCNVLGEVCMPFWSSNRVIFTATLTIDSCEGAVEVIK